MSKTIGLQNAVERFEMHDALGNTCAAALFKIGDTEYELYLWDFNSSVPRRVTGTLGACKAHMNAFYFRKCDEGFEPPLADVNGQAIRSQPPHKTTMSNDRNETILKIRTALKRRSGKQWSVTGGRGTVYGWLSIAAVPSRMTWAHRLKAGSVTDRPEDYEEYDSGEPGRLMSPADRAELAELLGLETVHCQGVSIAASSDHYREYVERAEGLAVGKIAQPYWD